jgi:membrane protein DedA with SNARE-associated domain
MKFGKFLYYETPAVLLSLFLMISIGLLSGLGFTYISDLFHNLYVAAGFILLITVVVVTAKLWIKKRIMV